MRNDSDIAWCIRWIRVGLIFGATYFLIRSFNNYRDDDWFGMGLCVVASFIMGLAWWDSFDRLQRAERGFTPTMHG